MSKRILVAGGAGFIGSNLVPVLLKAGHAVTVLDNLQTGRESNLARFWKHGNFAFRHADITRPLPEFGGFDQIYNLACAASPVRYQADPVHTLLTSVNGTYQLLELAQRCGARILMASTSEVYGDPLEHPQRENYFGNVNPNGPRACYDEGKRAAETLCGSFIERGVEVRIARIFNTYGPFMALDDGRVVSNILVQALLDRDITVYGDGRQTRSFCYVDDLVAGLKLLMESDRADHLPVNLGNPQEYSINEMVRIVMDTVPTRSRIVFDPLPVDDPRQRCPDISRAGDLLKWQPVVPFSKGVKVTARWFAQQMGSQEHGLAEPA